MAVVVLFPWVPETAMVKYFLVNSPRAWG